MVQNSNHEIPSPPADPRPSFEPPRINSVYNAITARIRGARTIFGDRVKLFLRQVEDDKWTKLERPYLLVVPRQVRNPREIDQDYLSFVNPREVIFIAQFDDRMSEASYLAANDIDTAEQQLIITLCNWRPDGSYKPTLYGGMRIQSTRAPDVKVAYTFIFYETIVVREEDTDDLPTPALLEGMNVHLRNPNCCIECVDTSEGPKITVTGGGCFVDVCDGEDECK